MGKPSKPGRIRKGVPQPLHERPKHVVLIEVRVILGTCIADSAHVKGPPGKTIETTGDQKITQHTLLQEDLTEMHIL